MRRIVFALAVVFLAVSAVTVQAQQAGAGARSIPAAVRSQSECSGFIANPDLPRDLFVVGGADDDFHSIARQFVEGESIFVSQQKGQNIAVGTEFRVVRPANELFLTMTYAGERRGIRRLGKPYEDVAVVRVTHVDPEGPVAKITFSCAAIVPGDLLVPFQPRPIPDYTISQPLDPFAPLDNNKKHGRITASHNNYGFLGDQTVVYLDLGENEGARPGQRFRIYKVLSSHAAGAMFKQPTPPETVGEAVVLSVQSKSCVAMVVAGSREISSGDYVEAE